MDIYDLVTSIIKKTAYSFNREDIAHVKVVLHSSEVAVKVSLVGDSMQVDGLKGSRYLSGEAELILNARVITDPERLTKVLRGAVDDLKTDFGLEITQFGERCFKPKPEAPSYFFKNL